MKENPKGAEDFAGDRIRREFVAPLTELVGDLEKIAKKIDRAIADDELPEPYLPVNARGARTALKKLQRFLKKELGDKLQDAKDGSYRYPQKHQKNS